MFVIIYFASFLKKPMIFLAASSKNFFDLDRSSTNEGFASEHPALSCNKELAMIAAAPSDKPIHSQAERKLERFIRFAGVVLKFSFHL